MAHGNQPKQSAGTRRYLTALDGLRTGLPGLYRFLEAEGDFTGFFINPTREGGFLGGVKRVGDDGTPQVIYASSYGVLEVLFQLDAALEHGAWRTDKRELARSSQS